MSSANFAPFTVKVNFMCMMPFSAYITGKSASGEMPSSGMCATLL